MRQVARPPSLRQPEVGHPDVSCVSSSRFDGLISRCMHSLLVGVFQGVRHLDADARHALPVRRLPALRLPTSPESSVIYGPIG